MPSLMLLPFATVAAVVPVCPSFNPTPDPNLNPNPDPDLQVSGGILGLPLVATADFVGTPSVQWHRSSSSSRGFVPIPGTHTAASNM